MAYRCILNNTKECDGCGACMTDDDTREENEGLTAQQIGDAEKEQELYEKGII